MRPKLHARLRMARHLSQIPDDRPLEEERDGAQDPAGEARLRIKRKGTDSTRALIASFEFPSLYELRGEARYRRRKVVHPQPHAPRRVPLDDLFEMSRAIPVGHAD